MPIAKTITGSFQVWTSIPLPPPSPLFPITVQASYGWFPTAAPAARGNPVNGTVTVAAAGNMTVGQLLQAIRAAAIAQETAADGGGHTVAEDTTGPG